MRSNLLAAVVVTMSWIKSLLVSPGSCCAKALIASDAGWNLRRARRSASRYGFIAILRKRSPVASNTQDFARFLRMVSNLGVDMYVSDFCVIERAVSSSLDGAR